jgi:hypothetical protein
MCAPKTTLCAGFGFGAHNAVADGTSQFRHTQSMGHVIFSAQSRRRCRQVFAGVLHAWVDFNFIAHRPLQLLRVSVSVRNQMQLCRLRFQGVRRCRQDFAGVLHAWVDFNFIAHRPLQLLRVSVSVRNQMQLCRLRFQGVQSRCKGGQFSFSVHAVPSHMLAGFSSRVVTLQKWVRANIRLVPGFAGLRHEADP